MATLSGRVAVVTGAGRGIGAAIAQRLGADGASVVVNYRASADGANAVVERIRRAGGAAIAVQADVTEDGAAEALVAAAIEEYGALHILVSNAGIEHFGPLASITKAEIDRVFSTNVTAQLLAAKAAAARMESGASIMLMSSGSTRFSVYEHSLYAASKAAIATLVRNLAPELGVRGIRINAIAPGGTNTDMAAEVGAKYIPLALRGLPMEALAGYIPVALQRYAEPSEIAAAVAFAVSDDASYMTGTTMQIDGGV